MKNSVSFFKVRRSQHGIALLECLIAMLIFSFGVLGLIGLEAQAINFSVDAEDRNRAALFAGEIASQMWVNGSVDKTTWNATAQAAYTTMITNGKAGLANCTVTVTVLAFAAPIVAANQADIKIVWHPPHDKASDPDSVLTTRVTLP